MRPKSCTMIERCICSALIIGYNPSTRSCSTHRPDTTRPGKGKESGLARVAAHPRPPKKRKPSASGTSFCDWIGGICYADTLQVWFPAHWAPVVLQQLQQKEDSYRAENPSWMDQEEAPADILTSNGRRQGQTDVCSSRLAIIEMVTG